MSELFTNIYSTVLFLTMSIIISCYFSSGYIGYFDRLWTDIFVNRNSKYPKWRRVQLVITGCGIGLFLHLGAATFSTGSVAIVFQNISLFLLVIPFLYKGGFGLLERVVQLAATSYVWINLHATGPRYVGSNMTHPLVIMAFIVTFVLLASSQALHDKIVFRWQYSLLYFLALGYLFWGTLPTGALSPLAIWEAIFIFVSMNMTIVFVWFNESRNNSASRKLENPSIIDALTKVKSFASFQVESKNYFNHSKNYDNNLAVVEWDIDRFKQINDRYGHTAGNQVLQKTAKIVKDSLNELAPDAILYRTGGEEFTILFPEQELQEVIPAINLAWENVLKTDYYYEDVPIEVTISMGGTEIKKSDETFTDVYNRVDEYLYMSKHNGRNMVTIEGHTRFSGKHRQQVIAMSAYFTQNIMVAMDDEQMVPQSAELLYRRYDYQNNDWITPEKIKIAIDNQLDLMSGFVTQSKRTYININLTLEQFLNDEAIQMVIDFKHERPTLQRLTLEIPELWKIKDKSRLDEIIDLFEAENIKVIENDISEQPFTQELGDLFQNMFGMKFNTQQVTDLTRAELIARVKPWVDYCKKHDMRFVLEGIETKQEFEVAKKLGVTYMQGFYFGIPELPILT